MRKQKSGFFTRSNKIPFFLAKLPIKKKKRKAIESKLILVSCVILKNWAKKKYKVYFCTEIHSYPVLKNYPQEKHHQWDSALIYRKSLV